MLFETIAKADTQETIPAFDPKLVGLPPDMNIMKVVAEQKDAGCVAVVGVRSGRNITIGSIDYEWRPLGAALFFVKRDLSSFKDEELVAQLRSCAEVDGEIPVALFAKAYSMMSSCGRGWLFGKFTAADVAEYLTFFEVKRARSGHIDDTVTEEGFIWKE